MSLLTWFKNLFKKNSANKSVYSPKRALCVGICTYPDPRNRLAGCANDAMAWSKLLQEVKGFPQPEILLDSQATRSAVTSRLKDMVSNAKAGDILVFTYSGHGTSVPTTHGDEDDGRDEAICLYDGLVIDDTIAEILAIAPEKVSITMILDSCHSGTMLKEFVMPGTEGDLDKKIRYMPPTDKVFAEMVPDLEVNSRMLVPHPEVPMSEILLAGCKDSESSYDACIERKPCGAFSHFATKLIRENPNMTYGQFGTMIDASLPSRDYPQHPQVECNPINLNRVMFS